MKTYFSNLIRRNLKINDFLFNIFYKIRFNFYRNIGWLKNHSKEEKKGFDLTFFDYFDEVSWGDETKKWYVGEHWGSYHPSKPNVYYGPPLKIENNKAVFGVTYEPRNVEINNEEHEIPFKVSCLTSYHSHKQQYGRWECRMTLPKERGTWPAFWMWGPLWPPEIDVIEAYGKETGKNVVYQEINIHWRDNGDLRTSIKPTKIKVDKYKNVGKNYYEFAVEWNPNGLYFYTNGIKVFQFTNKKILDSLYNKKDMTPWTVINHSVEYDWKNGGHRYITKEEESNYYSEFLVDYIRIYQYKS